MFLLSAKQTWPGMACNIHNRYLIWNGGFFFSQFKLFVSDLKTSMKFQRLKQSPEISSQHMLPSKSKSKSAINKEKIQ
jgi:hypothetical protein